MSDLKLSVIVPTRDRPEKLGRTPAALAEQGDLDQKDYELIVVDDGSVPTAAARTPREWAGDIRDPDRG